MSLNILQHFHGSLKFFLQMQLLFHAEKKSGKLFSRKIYHTIFHRLIYQSSQAAMLFPNQLSFRIADLQDYLLKKKNIQVQTLLWFYLLNFFFQNIFCQFHLHRYDLKGYPKNISPQLNLYHKEFPVHFVFLQRLHHQILY